jgi:DNA-binding MarR family transcriptional regulator
MATRTETNLLREVEGGLSFAGDIAAKYGIEIQSVTKILRGLKWRGLADWDPEPREAWLSRGGHPRGAIRRLWHLTDKGRRCLEHGEEKTTVKHTHTRTHLVVNFANPYLRCDKCRKPVEGFHDPEKCLLTYAAQPIGDSCGAEFMNYPCCCELAGVTSTCPSWGPVDGCRCKPRCEMPTEMVVLG